MANDLYTIAEHLELLVQYDENTVPQNGGTSWNQPYFLQDEGLDPDNRYIDDIQTFLGDPDKREFSPADRAMASLGPSYVGETRERNSYTFF
ncbi:MAG: hypothetical protein ISS01_00800 [Nanoarchaeota archaeon]|nr:hypothetical protein [Nanoarchaeota archaeon]